MCILYCEPMEQMECITISYDRNDLWNDLLAPAKQQHRMRGLSYHDNQSPPSSSTHLLRHQITINLIPSPPLTNPLPESTTL